MASYLVTGGTGYIGSRLVQRLTAKGDRVVLLYRRGAQVDVHINENQRIILIPTSSSSSDYREAIQQYEVDAVFHLASKANYVCPATEIAEMIEANITLGTLIMEAMNKTDCQRLINVGTYWQHFNGPDYNPTCLYAASKQAFMDMVTYYTKWHGLRCISLRLTDVYGNNDPRPKIFSLLDQAEKNGETLKLTKSEQLMSFLHVEDAVNALCEAASQTINMKAEHKSYGVGSKLIRLKDAVELYLTIKGKKLTIEWGGVPYRPTQIMNPWMGELLPNWQPTISLQDGLRSL